MRLRLANPKGLQQAGHWLALLEDGLLVLMLALMIILAGGQIVLRNLFDSGIAWSDPLLRVLVLWVGLLGAMAATRDDNHIRIDLLTRFLKPRHKPMARTVTALFTALVCGLIAWHGAGLVALEYQDGVRLFAAFPAWLAELIIPIGFAVMALRNALIGLSSLLSIGQHQP